MKIKKGVNLRKIAGESILMLQCEKGVDMTKVISLNPTSELLWNNIVNIEFSIDTIVNILLDNYDVSREEAQRDAQKWVNTLKSCDVIE